MEPVVEVRERRVAEEKKKRRRDAELSVTGAPPARLSGRTSLNFHLSR